MQKVMNCWVCTDLFRVHGVAVLMFQSRTGPAPKCFHSFALFLSFVPGPERLFMLPSTSQFAANTLPHNNAQSPILFVSDRATVRSRPRDRRAVQHLTLSIRAAAEVSVSHAEALVPPLSCRCARLFPDDEQAFRSRIVMQQAIHKPRIRAD